MVPTHTSLVDPIELARAKRRQVWRQIRLNRRLDAMFRSANKTSEGCTCREVSP